MTLKQGDGVDRGRYAIARVLGCGRFAITYLATDGRTAETVALKTLNDEARIRPDYDKLRQVFRDEAMLLKGCEHSHVVKVERLFEEDGAPWIVMEYVAGADLKEVGRLSVEEARCYVGQIGGALAYLHGRGIVHRDVRPANIRLRAGKAEAVLIDFGSALNFEDELSASETAGHADGCAAPEAHISKGRRGPHTDLYSLGATFYTLLEGRMPPDALAQQFRHEKLSFSGQYDGVLARAIESAMALDPMDRPRSVMGWLQSWGAVSLEPGPDSGRDWGKTVMQIASAVGVAMVAIGTLLGGIGAMSGWLKGDSEPATPPAVIPTPTTSPQ